MGIFGCSKTFVEWHEDALFEVLACVDWQFWWCIEGQVGSWSNNEVYLPSTGKEYVNWFSAGVTSKVVFSCMGTWASVELTMWNSLRRLQT